MKMKFAQAFRDRMISTSSPVVVRNVSESLISSVLVSAEASPSSDAWQTLQGASEDHKAFLEDLLVNYSCTCFTKSSDAA